MSSEWVEMQLCEIVAIKGGKRLPAGKSLQQEPNSHPYIRVRDVGQRNLPRNGLEYVPDELFPSISRYIVQPNDVILSIVGTIGALSIVDAHYNMASLTENCVKLHGLDRLDALFLYYCLSSPKGQQEIHRGTVGAVQPKLPIYNIEKINVFWPDRSFREKIASFLGALDDRIALLRETNATLEAIAQALFKSWFVDFEPVHAKARGEQPQGMDDATAALFPDSFEESELGMIPKGWQVKSFGEFVTRQSVGKKYDQKSALPEGLIPILDQGKSGIIGFHNDEPGVRASLDKPVVVFANHTCYMRLITFDFSAIQNVLPFIGKGIDTVWAFYATKDRVKFSEYKGHWPDFAIEKAVIPDDHLTFAFRNIVDSIVRGMRSNEQQAQTLAQLRDTLLPKLISGQLRLPEAEALLAEELP